METFLIRWLVGSWEKSRGWVAENSNNYHTRRSFLRCRLTTISNDRTFSSFSLLPPRPDVSITVSSNTKPTHTLNNNNNINNSTVAPKTQVTPVALVVDVSFDKVIMIVCNA